MLVFSSAEITNSSSCKALPSQLRAVQIENATSFVGKVGITREDPTAVIPGPNGILMQPAPKRAAADGRHQTGLTDLARQIRSAPARQRQVVGGGQFASPSLDLYDQIRGKKSGDDPDESALRARRDVPGRNVYATPIPRHGGCSSARQFRCFPNPRRPSRL